MPSGQGVDIKSRLRIVGHLRQVYETRQFRSVREMAGRLDYSVASLARVLNGEQGPGLELLQKVHQILHVSIDHMLDDDPPERYMAEVPRRRQLDSFPAISAGTTKNKTRGGAA